MSAAEDATVLLSVAEYIGFSWAVYSASKLPDRSKAASAYCDRLRELDGGVAVAGYAVTVLATVLAAAAWPLYALLLAAWRRGNPGDDTRCSVKRSESGDGA